MTNYDYEISEIGGLTANKQAIVRVDGEGVIVVDTLGEATRIVRLLEEAHSRGKLEGLQQSKKLGGWPNAEMKERAIKAVNAFFDGK